MIFITLGSQKFQFDRLLKEIDKLVEKQYIKQEVFAQSGYSEYIPKFYKSKKFLDRNEFADIMDRSQIVITHGGTGAIIGAVKKDKKVIAVPRKAQYGEHVDDHQVDIVTAFGKQGLIIDIQDVSELKDAISRIKNFVPPKYVSNTNVIVNDLKKYIESINT